MRGTSIFWWKGFVSLCFKGIRNFGWKFSYHLHRFFDDIGPIVSELSEYDIDCVAYSVRLRTVPVVLARALLMTSYRAYLWSIRACTMT